MKNSDENIIYSNGKKVDLRKLSNEELFKVAQDTLREIKRRKEEINKKVKKMEDGILK